MKAKITTVFVFFIVLYAVALSKALYIQVINRDKLIAYSDSQIVRKTKVYPKRGYISDRHGNPLAVNIQKYNLFTFAKDTKKLKKELSSLKNLIPNINVDKILKSAHKRKKFTWIKREIEINDAAVKKIKSFKTILLENKLSRFYPNHELAAQILGFVGIDNDGLGGIEYSFNDQLKGEPEIYKYFRDAKGRPVKFKSTKLDKRGVDLELSIDKDVQASLEDYLKEGVLKHEGSSGGAAVMDANTGEIIAMANYPTFDPNIRKKSKYKKLSFVTDPFEPGSVFKTLTVASALENNIVRNDTSYYCERGKYKVDNHYIKESDSSSVYEWLSVEDILKFSSNIGTTKIAFDLTYPTLRKTLKDFSIGKKTGIEVPGESRGILDKNENIKPLRLSNISFGQGVATTGIQMLASYAAFANGGYYVRPTLLKVKDPKDIEKKRILSKKTVKSITKMLIKAVKDGTGKNARVKHFQIAGKTSTAQRVDENGGYSGYMSGFIGYPVNIDNKFIVYVYVDNPKKGYYGNLVAAPIFKKITKSLLYKKKNIKKLARVIEDKETIDNISMKYSARKRIKRGEVPNLIGLDKSSAFNILEKLDISYNHRGFGIVESQWPVPGEKLSKNLVIKLNFKAPSYD